MPCPLAFRPSSAGLVLPLWLALSVANAAAALPPEVTFRGACDASAAQALGVRWLVTASDEDSTLRLYDRDRGGLPAATFDLAPHLQLAGKDRETDLEGSAQIGDLIYWTGSHGRNRDGKPRPNRHRFFATRVLPGDPPTLKFEGRPFTGLVEALAAEPALAQFDLARAATLSPEVDGGLNIESLAVADDGGLLLGFRSPVPGGQALIVPLRNPAEVIAGRLPQFGPPLRLDLGGRGIRSFQRVGDQYLVVGGHATKGGDFAFYLWDGRATTPRRLPAAAPRNLTIETAILDPQAGLSRVFCLSDDGTRPVGSRDCKDVKDPALRQFRGVWVALE